MKEEVSCRSCGQLSTYTKVVVSRGNPFASLMVIGEAPGAKEDEVGEPFIGRSGVALDNLMKSVGIDCEQDVYISNVVKCRPPNNRRPTKKEIDAFMPWLHQQIKLVDPLVIALAGATAVEALLGIKQAISDVRGKWQRWKGRWVMPIFHPAYLLRNPSKEEGAPVDLTRGDLLKVRRKLIKYNRPIVMPVLELNRGQNP